MDEATGAPGAKDDHDIGSGSVVPETASSMPPAEDVQTVFKRKQPEHSSEHLLHVCMQAWLRRQKSSMPNG